MQLQYSVKIDLSKNLFFKLQAGKKYIDVWTNFPKSYMQVLLALNGRTGRSIMSQWLRRKGVCTWEASEWNELTQILQEAFQSSRNAGCCFVKESSTSEMSRMRASPKELNSKKAQPLNLIIVVDIGLLDLSTNIWKEQLNFLDKYHGKVKFVWVVNHDTSGVIKMELRKKGHLLMVSRPLYKAKMIQILDAVIKERKSEFQREGNTSATHDLHECLEIDHTHFDAASSDDSDTSDRSSNDSRGTFHIEGEKGKRTLASHPSHFKMANSRKEYSIFTTNLDKIVRSPNRMVLSDNVMKFSEDFISSKYRDGYSNMDHSDNDKNDEVIKRTKTIAELEAQPEAPQEDVPHMKYSNNSDESSQVHLEEKRNKKQEQQCQIWPIDDTGDLKCNSVYDQKASVSGNLHSQVTTKRPGRSTNIAPIEMMSESTNEQDCMVASKSTPCHKSLEGLCILLAEDTPVLQRVATIMLEKMGATVIPVGDGLQAVDTLKCKHSSECRRENAPQQDGEIRSRTVSQEIPSFDLILMDCQVSKHSAKPKLQLLVVSFYHFMIVL